MVVIRFVHGVDAYDLPVKGIPRRHDQIEVDGDLYSVERVVWRTRGEIAATIFASRVAASTTRKALGEQQS